MLTGYRSDDEGTVGRSTGAAWPYQAEEWVGNPTTTS